MPNGIAQALGGFSAGLQGNGAQYSAMLDQREALDREKRMQNEALSHERLKAMVQDSYGVKTLLESGKTDAALKLLKNRIDHINKLGGDPTDTKSVYDQLVSGDPTQFAAAQKTLTDVVDAGVAGGLWAPPQESLESKKFTAQQDQFKQEFELKKRAQDWKEAHPNEGNASNPYYQFIPTSEGLAVGNARTGQVSMAGGGANGNLMPIGADVGLKERMAGASATGEGEAKRVLDAKGAEKRVAQLSEGIKQAKDLIPKATGSMAGAARDAMGRAVGVSTEASKAAARLDTLAGWMVANVPRMEGPQSNIDVENYKTMAARVGDRTATQEERLAALDELETLQNKYSGMNKETIAGKSPNLSGQDKQAYDWAKANPNDPRSAQILNKLGAK